MKILTSNISKACKVKIDFLKDSESASYDKNDMKEKVIYLVRFFFFNFRRATKYFLMFYFHNFIFEVKGVAAQNIQTSRQGDLRKPSHVK